MTSKELFQNYKANKDRLKQLNDELEFLNEEDSIRSIQFLERTSPTNKINNPIMNLVEYKETKTSQIKAEINLLEHYIRKTDMLLTFLEKKDQAIFKCKFIDSSNLTIKRIDERFNYSNGYIHKIINKRCKELDEIICSTPC